MLLHAVTSSARLALTDRDAAPPSAVPGGKALARAIDHEATRLSRLQRVFYADARHALLIVLQGRDAAGKDGTIRSVFVATNPQGCRVTSFKEPTDLELRHDFLWRVHQAVPPRGIIGIFNRSHYEDVLVARVHGLVPTAVWRTRYEQINAFERMLTRNGVVILKFFLHVSRGEQRRRLLDRLTDRTKNWKFRAGDLDDRARWRAYTAAYRDALRKCSTRWAPWYVVPADDKKVRDYLVAKRIARAMEQLRPRYPRADPDVLALASKII
jgi:PPK2 family polyphosphate:nucleotide phosphotransferase